MQDYNQRLAELQTRLGKPSDEASESDYRIGAEDLLNISIYGAPDLGRTVRVSAEGEISLPLVGEVQAAGLTPRGLEAELENRLRQKYMNDPQVTVFLAAVQSHPVAVLGAVGKPGVYQISDPKTLIEMLSMAQGLTEDAGNRVIVMRHGEYATPAGAGSASSSLQVAASSPSNTFVRHASQNEMESKDTKSMQVDLKDLLSSGDARYNILVYPGDIVKVPQAGIVYVVGEVHKPGGFVLKASDTISVLQALALAEGVTRTSAASRARIIRTDEATGARAEIPIDLKRILSGKAPDPMLHAKDIIFVPNSTAKSALYRGTEAAITIAAGVIVYR
ncbi:MAG TPA: polysaccharide biosynthesis/export family protein [Candidatus Acidoferrales bacterium]|nr:polysaccharide biosynthesis/export family protein [Candidatus Acidoferrales bacterium]